MSAYGDVISSLHAPSRNEFLGSIPKVTFPDLYSRLTCVPSFVGSTCRRPFDNSVTGTTRVAFMHMLPCSVCKLKTFPMSTFNTLRLNSECTI
ncbi:unnamed protein product [Dicrocoelium dendriticum]|nr:unnamed protein product [Dicrocoelium dendriticum]